MSWTNAQFGYLLESELINSIVFYMLINMTISAKFRKNKDIEKIKKNNKD